MNTRKTTLQLPQLGPEVPVAVPEPFNHRGQALPGLRQSLIESRNQPQTRRKTPTRPRWGEPADPTIPAEPANPTPERTTGTSPIPHRPRAADPQKGETN